MPTATIEVTTLAAIGMLGSAMLLAILLSSSLAKLISLPTRVVNSVIRNTPEDWAESTEFAVTELFAALVLATATGTLAAALVALAALPMVVIGLTRNLVTGKPCNCFGAVTPKSKLTMGIIQIATLAAAGATVLSSRASIEIGLAVAAMLAGAAVVPVVAWRVKRNQLNQIRPVTTSKSQGQAPSLRHLPPDLVLGNAKDGRTVTVGQVIREGHPLFIVGVNSKCNACKKLVPDIYAFAKGFASQFPIIIVADEQGYLPPGEAIDTFYRLVDTQQRFMFDQRIDGMPYAVLVNGSTGKTMSPPAQGEAGVRSLFAIMLNARLTT
ncbi:MAG: hypothetical protein Q8L45_04115 [Xanthomonadaceae bacterium]|nr:hypothetical protein [Xanthomonadaceae bacterium]MDZ4379567.1 hypothetical protein [Xanthomonadaceae bacterium]